MKKGDGHLTAIVFRVIFDWQFGGIPFFNRLLVAEKWTGPRSLRLPYPRGTLLDNPPVENENGDRREGEAGDRSMLSG